MIIEGAIATKAALLNNKREVKTIYIDQDKKDRNTDFIIKNAHNKNIEIKYLKRADIDDVASGKTHGGIIANVSERKYLDKINIKAKTIFVIDGIEDPFNLAYIFRTLKAFNYPNIIMPQRDLSNMENTLLKSSAGAFDMVDIYLSFDLLSDIKMLKNYFSIYALSRSEKAYNLFDYEVDKKSVIILGGEKRGIKKDVLNECIELYIPYFSDFKPALNACSALACVASALRIKERK